MRAGARLLFPNRGITMDLIREDHDRHQEHIRKLNDLQEHPQAECISVTLAEDHTVVVLEYKGRRWRIYDWAIPRGSERLWNSHLAVVSETVFFTLRKPLDLPHFRDCVKVWENAVEHGREKGRTQFRSEVRDKLDQIMSLVDLD